MAGATVPLKLIHYDHYVYNVTVSAAVPCALLLCWWNSGGMIPADGWLLIVYHLHSIITRHQKVNEREENA